jgi:uncharacterized membrane protein YkvA (DUF1232 family)
MSAICPPPVPASRRPPASPGSRPRRGPAWLVRLRRRAKRLKRQLWSLYLAWRDPATPWAARLPAIIAIAYALSPIDLIPDFVPLLGQLDDLLILPALIALALKLVPPEVAARCRREAWRHWASGDRIKSPAGAAAAVAFALAWLALAAWVASRFV